jgi:malonyl-CoA O-methyltransferase
MALKHKSDQLKPRVAQQFSKASKRYAQAAKIQKEIAEFTRSAMPSNDGFILDIGCASGEHSKTLGKKVLGVDLALGMVQQASKNHAQSAVTESADPPPWINWINADMDHLPLVSESVDQVFSSMALQWSTRPSDCLSEIFRVLKKEGTACLMFPVEGAFWQIKHAYAQSGLNHTLHPLNTEQEWTQAAVHCGFQKVVSSTHRFVDERADFLDLLRTNSKVGASASSNQNGNEITPLSKSRLNTLAERYPKTHGGFTLDYHCVLLELVK